MKDSCYDNTIMMQKREREERDCGVVTEQPKKGES